VLNEVYPLYKEHANDGERKVEEERFKAKYGEDENDVDSLKGCEQNHSVFSNMSIYQLP
jgi:hypothetical protein